MPKFKDTPRGTYRRSPEGEAHRRMIGSAAWKKYAKAYLEAHPLCCCPHHRGQDVRWPSEVVDHIKAPKGDRKLFWDRKNHVAMHSHCHNSFKQSEERGGAGFHKGCDESGFPLSGSHHWNSPLGKR